MNAQPQLETSCSADAFYAARRAMLASWQALIAAGAASEQDLREEIVGTENAMTQLLKLSHG